MTKKPRKSLWGFGAAAIYASFVLFILSLVLYASMQDVQLVEAGYYEQGLDYQARIDRLNRSQELDHRLTIEHRYSESQIILSLMQPNATEAVGTIRQMRPSNARMDREWQLSLNDSGQQVLATEDLPSGQWKLEIDWKLNSIEYLNETRIVIP